MSDWIEILPTPLDTNRAVAFVTSGTAGGIAVFLGTTRAEKNPDGRDLISLDYEAYEEMAIEQLKKLAADARSRWPIIKLALLHRTG